MLTTSYQELGNPQELQTEEGDTSVADPIRVCVPKEGLITRGSAVLFGPQKIATMLCVPLLECRLQDEFSYNSTKKKKEKVHGEQQYSIQTIQDMKKIITGNLI